MSPSFSYQQTVKPNEPALITEIIARRLALPFARLAYALGLSANAVTLIAGLCWVLSTPLAVFAGWLFHAHHTTAGTLSWFLCGCLWNAGYILDLADGSLARMTHTSSRRGFYLDYVFHLLFKPAFLASIGIGLAFMHSTPLLWLLLSILSIPANWSASASAVEHVLCEEVGKKHLDPSSLSPHLHDALWLGTTSMNCTASQKRTSLTTLFKTLATEILSYYGQFTFFSFLVLLDLFLTPAFPSFPFPCTSLGFLTLALVMLARTPLRILREYHRIAQSDSPNP